jgi:hypothetical protein
VQIASYPLFDTRGFTCANAGQAQAEASIGLLTFEGVTRFGCRSSETTTDNVRTSSLRSRSVETRMLRNLATGTSLNDNVSEATLREVAKAPNPKTTEVIKACLGDRR